VLSLVTWGFFGPKIDQVTRLGSRRPEYSRGRKRFLKRDFRVRVAFLSLTIGSIPRHRLGVSMCKHLAALVSR
jgi:hypothetical protein